MDNSVQSTAQSHQRRNVSYDETSASVDITSCRSITNRQCPTTPCCVRWIGDGKDPYVALNGVTCGLVAEGCRWTLTSRCSSPLLHVCCRDNSVASLSPLILLPLRTTLLPPLYHCAPSKRGLLITISPHARMSLEEEHCIRRLLGAICGNGYGSLPRCRGLGTAVKLVVKRANE